MKKLILIILSLWGIAYGQTVNQVRYDTTKFLKVGGTSEVKILNTTMGNVGGVFTNVGGGWGQWLTPTSGGGVDSLYRKNGIDSIYWIKNGIEHAIKDSVGAGSLGGASFKLLFSNTAPADTSSIWVNTSMGRLGWYPFQYWITPKNQWSTPDTISGMGYDTVGKVLYVKAPDKGFAAGQSNITAPDYLQPDGFVGDTLPDPRFTVFDSTTLKFKVARIGQYPFVSTVSENWLFHFGKRMVKESGRSLRLVVQCTPGKALDWWSGSSTGIPDTAQGFAELTNRLTASGIGVADFFLWDQGEGGIGTGGNYFNKWKQVNDSLRRKGYTDSATKVLLIGLANYFGQLPSVGITDPEGALRAHGMTNDLYIGHVSSMGIPNDGIHNIPRSGRPLGDRAWEVYKSLPRNIYTNGGGYKYIPPGGLSDTSKNSSDGKMWVNVNGYAYIKTGINDVFFGDPIAWPTRTGMWLQKTSGTGSLRIFDYGGNILSFLNDGYMRWNGTGGALSPSWNALSGASPYLSLWDGTNKWKWRADWSPYGTSVWDYNGATLMAASTQGTLQIGSATPERNPTKALDIKTTTQGLGLPVMTQAQRDAIKEVISVTIGAGGTSYVGGSALTFSGGGGSGARAAITVSSGVITAVLMISGGKGYTSAPTATAPTGSGATLTPVLGVPTGLTIYQSDNTPGIYYYDGSAWVMTGGGGGSYYNSNIGSGFRLAVPGTNNLKTIFAGYGVSLDSSSNTNGITAKIDSATIYARVKQIVHDSVGISSTLTVDPLAFKISGDTLYDKGAPQAVYTYDADSNRVASAITDDGAGLVQVIDKSVNNWGAVFKLNGLNDQYTFGTDGNNSVNIDGAGGVTSMLIGGDLVAEFNHTAGTATIPAPSGTLLGGKLNVGVTQDFADNAAAITGGLVVGDVYRTGDVLKIVH